MDAGGPSALASVEAARVPVAGERDVDAALVGNVHALGIDEADARVLALLPVVRVAWADGAIQSAERDTILSLATESYGLGDEGRIVLESWLTYPPSEAYVDKGREVLLALISAQEIGIELESRDVLDEVLTHAKDVAAAAGGFFGIRAIDAKEQSALDELHTALTRARAARPSLDGAPAVKTTPPPVRRAQTTVPPDDWEDKATDPGAPGSAAPTFSMEEHDAEDTDIFSLAELDALSAYVPPPPEVTRGEVAALIAIAGDLEVAHPIGAGGLTIGRHGSNDVVLAHDNLASRRHAVLEVVDDKLYVVDLDSANGTFVNGERIQKRRLFGGEEVRAGGGQFTYQAPANGFVRLEDDIPTTMGEHP